MANVAALTYDTEHPGSHEPLYGEDDEPNKRSYPKGGRRLSEVRGCAGKRQQSYGRGRSANWSPCTLITVAWQMTGAHIVNTALEHLLQ